MFFSVSFRRRQASAPRTDQRYLILPHPEQPDEAASRVSGELRPRLLHQTGLEFEQRKVIPLVFFLRCGHHDEKNRTSEHRLGAHKKNKERNGEKTRANQSAPSPCRAEGRFASLAYQTSRRRTQSSPACSVGSEVRRFRGRKKRVLVFSFFQFRTIGRLVLNLDLVTLSQKKKQRKSASSTLHSRRRAPSTTSCRRRSRETSRSGRCSFFRQRERGEREKERR